jgi:lysophospholipase L1-like esterase
MKPSFILLGLTLSLATTAPAAAPKGQPPVWVGAWAYVTTPLAPGVPPTLPSWPFVRVVPLAPLSASVAAYPIAPVENPGGLPVDGSFEDLTNVTIRQIVRVSAAGSAVRLRLSNESGGESLAVGAVHVGLAGPDGTVLPGTDRVVAFAGNGSVVIPAGAPLLSDSVPLSVKALDRLAISLHVPGRVALRNARSLPAYIAGPNGDSAAAAQLPQPRIARAPALVTEVEVAAAQPTNVVVALGDSITEGAGSTALAFHGWPDRLADRLVALPGRVRWAVVGAGISGNRLLRYGAGPNALARFDRDVLSVPGLATIILLEGINDIGNGFNPAGSTEPVTADALKSAYRQIIERAHEHGVRVIGGTLTPYKGAGYASDAGEAVRQEINAWIRSSGVFDGVVDFDAAIADKADPHIIDKSFNDGDRLHPNDAGYKAMADAIDLKLLTGK